MHTFISYGWLKEIIKPDMIWVINDILVLHIYSVASLLGTPI